MKLIIDIPEEVYKTAKNTNIIQANADMLEKTIINGIPLEQIRDEIAVLDDADYDYEGYYKAVTDAVNIIDKYTKGE